MYAIEARGLVKTYSGVTAVEGLDLLIEEGDVVGLLGPNGAGKTTTLMMLLGITTPDAGTIRLLGHPLPK
jgi:ABC-type multidrug transport system ATPase subunit